MLALEKNQFDEIEQDFKTSPENWAAATSKVWRDSGRASFSPHSKRQKKGPARRVTVDIRDRQNLAKKYEGHLQNNKPRHQVFDIISSWQL